MWWWWWVPGSRVQFARPRRGVKKEEEEEEEEEEALDCDGSGSSRASRQ